MRTLLHDLSFALRTFYRAPGFTVVAVLTLALGIGATTAMFSVVSGVLLRPLPFPDPHRLVQLWQVSETGRLGQFSGPNFEDLRRTSDSFAALAVYAQSPLVVVPPHTEPVRVQGVTVSDDFFRAVGMQPIAGRTFTQEELQPGGPPAALVTEHFWRMHLGADRALRNAMLTIDGRVMTVVGVLPDALAYPPQASIWEPTRGQQSAATRTGHNWRVIGRLQNDVHLDRARHEVSAIAARLRAEYGQDTWMVDAALVPLHEQMIGNSRVALLMLLGAVGLLLLIACANLIHLLLRQAASRRREIAVRSALGARGGRVVRQCMTESALLVAMGGALGMLVALLALKAMLALDGGRLPRSSDIAIDYRVALFAFGVSLVVALALGVVTARHALRFDLQESLKAGGQQAGARAGYWVRSGMLVSQLAFTLMLVVGAGLLARSFIQLISVDPGFEPGGVLTAEMSNPFAREDEQRRRLAQAHDELLERLAATPGIVAAGGINWLPLTGGAGTNGQFLIMNPTDVVAGFEDFQRLAREPDRLGFAEYRVASGGYFQAMRIPLVRGRLFDDRDVLDAPHVAVISESLAQQQWPGEDPIGKLIQFGNMDGDLRPFTIVGIVGDVRDASLAAPAQPTFYAHFRQRINGLHRFTVVARGTGRAVTLAPAMHQLVRDVQPATPVQLRTADDVIAASVAERRFQLTLLATFGGTALFLALVGVYGVTSYGVTQRRQEIGVRIALGARRRDIMALVLTGSMRSILAGIVLGLAGALLLTRFLQSLLFGIPAQDPLTLAAVALALAGATALACYVPAHRATKVDPIVALRYE